MALGVIDVHSIKLHANPRSRTGLGIAGLRNRVEALHGTFELISQRGIGAQIRAKLPISRTSN